MFQRCSFQNYNRALQHPAVMQISFTNNWILAVIFSELQWILMKINFRIKLSCWNITTVMQIPSTNKLNFSDDLNLIITNKWISAVTLNLISQSQRSESWWWSKSHSYKEMNPSGDFKSHLTVTKQVSAVIKIWPSIHRPYRRIGRVPGVGG